MSASRRILLINYEYPPIGGGGGNATQEIARALARRGHQPFVITAAWKDLSHAEVKDGVTIRRLAALRRRADRCSVPEMAAFLAAALLAAPGLARQWRIEVVLAFFALPCGPVGWWLKRWRGLPYAISLQGGDVPGFDPGLLANYHRATGGVITHLWRDAGAVVANSNGLAALARRHAPAQTIDVIPAGADVEAFTPRTTSGGDEVRLLFVGRLVSQKGLDVLLNALAKLPDRKWKLVLVGDGPQSAELSALAGQLGLTDRIERKGWVDKALLPEIYRTGDIFVLPSRDEGMPNALLEAMSSGLPVMGTRIAGTEEVVIDGETGVLVKSEDADAMAAALGALMNDPLRRAAYGKAGRARIEEKYSWPAIAAQWADVLERLVTRR